MPDSISCDNWELARDKFKIFLFRGVGIMFDNNCINYCVDFCLMFPEIVIILKYWYIRLPGPLFELKLEKIKIIHPEKNLLYFRKWNFLAQKQLNKTFLNFLVCAALVWLTGHHVTPLVTKCFPPNSS